MDMDVRRRTLRVGRVRPAMNGVGQADETVSWRASVLYCWWSAACTCTAGLRLAGTRERACVVAGGRAGGGSVCRCLSCLTVGGMRSRVAEGRVHSWWSPETSVPYMVVRPSGGASWDGTNETASRRAGAGVKERRVWRVVTGW